jgi:hypothetical protein
LSHTEETENSNCGRNKPGIHHGLLSVKTGLQAQLRGPENKQLSATIQCEKHNSPLQDAGTEKLAALRGGRGQIRTAARHSEQLRMP